MSNDDSYLPGIAYFAVRRTLDGEGHIGAALVIDGKGIPMEFRCTVPVRASAVQTALYGATIREFIAFNLCGRQALESLTTAPSLCLVESESDLGLQEYARIPVAWVSRIASAAESGALRQQIPQQGGVPNSEPGNRDSNRSIRLDSPASFHPVSLKYRLDWDKILENSVPGMQSLFGCIDLVEPFERITAGCRLLCEQDKRFR